VIDLATGANNHFTDHRPDRKKDNTDDGVDEVDWHVDSLFSMTACLRDGTTCILVLGFIDSAACRSRTSFAS